MDARNPRNEAIGLAQYHNLDDSGDPGLTGAASSSSHFALAMVQLAERAPMPELAAVRQVFHFAPTFEFKYHKTKLRHKDLFFESIRPIPFRVRAVVAAKPGLQNEFPGIKGAGLAIELIVRLTLRASAADLRDDILIIDGSPPKFRRALRVRLSEECRRTGRANPFKKIVSGDSEGEDGLQLADMIVGAVRESVAGTGQNYYRTFANKVVDLWRVQ